MNEVSRQEYNQGQQRIHGRIDKINDSSISIAKSVEHIDTMVTKMHEVMFGNGKTGALTRLSNTIQELKAHRWFFILIGSGLAGVFFYLIKKALTK